MGTRISQTCFWPRVYKDHESKHELGIYISLKMLFLVLTMIFKVKGKGHSAYDHKSQIFVVGILMV